jgi:hypothetical protein
MMMNEKREVISLFCRNHMFRLHLDDSFEDLHKWLKTLSQYQKMKDKAKNAVEQLLDEKITDCHDTYKTSVVGFVKKRHKRMITSGICNVLKPINNVRKFIAYLVVIQEGKGYTSHSCANCELFELDFTSGDENQWSQEHLDESKIYSISNVVLNTLHFQSSTQNPSSNLSVEYKKLINDGGEGISDAPDKVEDYVPGTVYRKLIGDLPNGIRFYKNKYLFDYTKDDGKPTTKNRCVTKKVSKENARERILEDFKSLRFNDWKQYQEKKQLGKYHFYHCKQCIEDKKIVKKICYIYRSKYDSMYMITEIDLFERHELSYILADTQTGSAQWTIEKFKQFQNKNFCEQEESKERKEQIDKFIVELDEFIGKFKNDDEIPLVKKTPIVYQVINVLKHCISHTKDRNETIRENNEKNNENKKEQDILSKKDLFILITNEIKEHRLRCFYSNVKMSFSEMRFDFALSIERLNEDLGYVEKNLKLVCKEFNTGHRQWSRELFNKTFRC